MARFSVMNVKKYEILTGPWQVEIARWLVVRGSWHTVLENVGNMCGTIVRRFSVFFQGKIIKNSYETDQTHNKFVLECTTDENYCIKLEQEKPLGYNFGCTTCDTNLCNSSTRLYKDFFIIFTLITLLIQKIMSIHKYWSDLWSKKNLINYILEAWIEILRKERIKWKISLTILTCKYL